MRLSRSHSTGMCIQRLSAAASDGLRPAISFIFSKKSCGKMCGKMSRRCSALDDVFFFAFALLIFHSRHVGELAPARGLVADGPPEGLAGERLGDFLPDVDDALAVLRIRADLRQLAPQPLDRLRRRARRDEDAEQRA